MKTKLLLILLIMSLILSLAACGGTGDTEPSTGGDDTPGADGGDTGDGGDTDAEKYADYLFGGSIIPNILAVDKTALGKCSTLRDMLKEHLGKAPAILQTDRFASKGHEIVVGRTTRPISEKAYKALERVVKDSDFDVTYVIYAEGNSVAIAFSEDYGSLALEFAFEDLMTNVIGDKTELNLTSGKVSVKAVSALDHYEKLDKEYKEEAWGKLYAALGSENKLLGDAIHSLYTSVYDPRLCSWLANLYDPEIGGFYYSNSARDSYGYGPDIESTSQALSFIGRSGMAYLHGNHYTHIFSREMMDDIGYYVKSLQDPDGYFYNYQWKKSSHGTSRLARDLSQAVGILGAVGMQPTYKTPLGGSGDGIVVPLPEAAKPVALIEQSSTATAVSKVVLSVHAPQLDSCETLLAYLEGLKTNIGKLRWYGIGSNINSMTKQIMARDKELEKEFFSDPANNGKTYSGLVDLVINWFNENQNPETGHWESTSNYLAVNGILKISGIYGQVGAPMNYTDKMCIAAFDAITSDEEMTGVVDIYNAWAAVSGVIGAVKRGSDAVVDGVMMTPEEQAEKLSSMVRANALAAVEATKEKLLVFRKADGSFSYTPKYSSASSQGMPVAKPYSVEGDVNATELAVNATRNAMLGVLGLGEYNVNPFGAAEMIKFMYTIENLSPVVKKDAPAEDDTVKPTVSERVTFDKETVGIAPTDFAITPSAASTATVIKDSRGTGNALRLESAANTGDFIYIPNGGNQVGDCIVFECDIKVESCSDYFAQITIGKHYLVTLHANNNTVVINENTTTSANTSKQRRLGSAKVGEWFTLRVEQYRTANDGKPVTKIYINGMIAAVSTCYYGLTKGGEESPSTQDFAKVTFYIMKTPAVDIVVDNLYATSTEDAYKAPEKSEGIPLFNDLGL